VIDDAAVEPPRVVCFPSLGDPATWPGLRLACGRLHAAEEHHGTELADARAIGPSMWAMSSRVVVRQWPRQAKSVMRRVARDMRERKRSFGMSIEGRRSPDGELSPYKKGAAVLAIEAQARIIPFYVHGARAALPVGAWRVRPGHIHAVTLEPIDARGMTLDDRHALTDRLRELADRERARGPQET
jgi:1-acyl-sn-glycerol-3-phosphate acyltransferase